MRSESRPAPEKEIRSPTEKINANAKEDFPTLISWYQPQTKKATVSQTVIAANRVILNKNNIARSVRVGMTMKIAKATENQIRNTRIMKMLGIGLPKMLVSITSGQKTIRGM